MIFCCINNGALPPVPDFFKKGGKNMKTLNEWREEHGLAKVEHCSYIPKKEDIEEYRERRDKNVTGRY